MKVLIRVHLCLSAAIVWPGARAAEPPTFAHDIAPIVYEKCASCHHPGGVAPFSLLTYDDVKKRAAQIAAATRSGFMPPWLPQEGHGDFAGDLRLTSGQIAAIAAWASAGAPEGAAAEIPQPPSFTAGWQLGPPDQILEAQSSVQLPAFRPAGLFYVLFFSPLTASPPRRAGLHIT